MTLEPPTPRAPLSCASGLTIDCLTAVLSIFALGLLLDVGVVDRPGEPAGQIELAWGWCVGLVGTVLMLAGSALRAPETERRRKPPGTI